VKILEDLKNKSYREKFVRRHVDAAIGMLMQSTRRPATREEVTSIGRTLETLLRTYIGALIKNPDVARRQVHAKGPPPVVGEFIVGGNVPARYRHGILAKPGTYPVWVRWSNGAQTVQPDKKPDVRGMAVKVMNVPGDTLLSDEPHTQDWLDSNGKGFFVGGAEDYVGFTKALSHTNPVLQAAALLWFFIVEGRWQEFGNLNASRNRKVASYLAEPFWSQVPYHLGLGNGEGDYIKHMFQPQAVDQREPGDSPNYLGERLVESLKVSEFRFDFMMQLRRCPEKLPTENASVIWDESHSPFEKVAELRIPRQEFDTDARRQLGENMFFFPWHCLREHEPAGGVSLARLAIYFCMSNVRHEINGVDQRAKPDLLKSWQEAVARLPENQGK